MTRPILIHSLIHAYILYIHTRCVEKASTKQKYVFWKRTRAYVWWFSAVMRGIPDAKSIQVAQDVTRRGLQSNTAGTGQKPIMTRRKSQASDFPLVDMVDQKATADQQKIRGLLLPVSIDKPHRRKKMQKTMGTVFSSLWSLRWSCLTFGYGPRNFLGVDAWSPAQQCWTGDITSIPWLISHGHEVMNHSLVTNKFYFAGEVSILSWFHG